MKYQYLVNILLNYPDRKIYLISPVIMSKLLTHLYLDALIQMYVGKLCIYIYIYILDTGLN